MREMFDGFSRFVSHGLFANMGLLCRSTTRRTSRKLSVVLVESKSGSISNFTGAPSRLFCLVEKPTIASGSDTRSIKVMNEKWAC